MLSLLDGVGVLVLAAARASFLLLLFERTYLAVPVLVVNGLAPRVDALVALKDALVLHLVDADDLRAALADEALVGPLAVLVAVLKEFGELRLRICLLDRLLAYIILRLFEIVGHV